MAIIIDNGSDPDTVRALQGLAEFSNIVLNANKKNLGIAEALNQGVQIAGQLGFHWIVTFDQDTSLHINMLQHLLEVYAKCRERNVLLGANYWDARKNRNFLQCRDVNAAFHERKTLITSGTLTPIRLFQEIGPFRKDYFIDSVDHEICLRARAHGWQILISCKPCMSHSIGSEMDGASWLRKKLSFNHSPARKYFIARNTITTTRLYFWREPLWCLRQICRLMADILSVVLFERQKSKKMWAFAVGLGHGMLGKLGPLEEAWPNGFR